MENGEAIAVDKDGNEYELIPDDQETEDCNKGKTGKDKKAKKSEDTDSDKEAEEDKYLTPKQKKLPPALKAGIIAKAKKKAGVTEEILGEDNPWHGSDGRFPKGGMKGAYIWSLYGKRKWLKKHSKTGKVFLKSVNPNHKKFGSKNAGSVRNHGRFAKKSMVKIA